MPLKSEEVITMATAFQLNLRNVAIATLLIAVGVGVGATNMVDGVPMLNSASQDGATDGQTPEDGSNTIASGKAASLELATFDRSADSTSQVGTDVYTWKTDSEGTIYLGSSASGASSRAVFDAFVTGESFKAIGFGSTYDYGAMVEGDINQERKLANMDVYKGASPSDIETTVYDSNGDSTTSVTLGSDEQKALGGLEVRVGASNVALNPSVIAFSLPDGTNVSDVEVKGAEKIPVPQRLQDSGSYDYAFKAFSANEGKPSMMEWDSQRTDSIVITADNDGTNGETLDYAVLDRAPFINGNDRLGYGVEDDSNNPTDVGVGDITGSLTLN